uniref:Uncharacterized protein n=1 Tax=viral metagenome TaxID=1070528 RepID=A0A6M3LK36_9ZZZZ
MKQDTQNTLKEFIAGLSPEEQKYLQKIIRWGEYKAEMNERHKDNPEMFGALRTVNQAILAVAGV